MYLDDFGAPTIFKHGFIFVSEISTKVGDELTQLISAFWYFWNCRIISIKYAFLSSLFLISECCLDNDIWIAESAIRNEKIEQPVAFMAENIQSGVWTWRGQELKIHKFVFDALYCQSSIKPLGALFNFGHSRGGSY